MDKLQARQKLKARFKAGEKWEDIANSLGKNGVTISRSAVWQFAIRGKEPANQAQRNLLGLPPKVSIVEVVNISGKVIVSGTQIKGSRQCACGYWFVPNIHNRKNCYICNPGKKRKK